MEPTLLAIILTLFVLIIGLITKKTTQIMFYIAACMALMAFAQGYGSFHSESGTMLATGGLVTFAYLASISKSTISTSKESTKNAP